MRACIVNSATFPVACPAQALIDGQMRMLTSWPVPADSGFAKRAQFACQAPFQGEGQAVCQADGSWAPLEGCKPANDVCSLAPACQCEPGATSATCNNPAMPLTAIPSPSRFPPSLTSLVLANMRLRSSSGDPFPSPSKLADSALRVLHITDSALTALPALLLSNQGPSLSQLSLARNAIGALPPGMLRSLPALTHADLSGNNMSALPAPLFHPGVAMTLL